MNDIFSWENIGISLPLGVILSFEIMDHLKMLVEYAKTLL